MLISSDIRRMHSFMNDFWKFQKEFWDIKEDQDYWDDLLLQANALVSKYGGDPYIMQLVLTFVEHCDRSSKEAHYGKAG